MEKLQKALEKARDQRTTIDVANAPRGAGPSAPTGGMTPIDSAWAALASFEPNRSLLDKNLLVSLEADQKAAPFDILRTKTQLLMQKSGWSRLAITSPTPACGKTTMACNLALGFTRQSDLRVVLIEFDLRRPNMAKVLGHTPPRDITSMLNGDVSFADQAVRIGSNLAIAIARHSSADPTSVLLSQKTHAVLKEIEDTYAPDVIIFDLPPVLVSDDTRAFLKDVDCALIVAKAEATSASQIDTCEREIAEQTNVLGVVLNQCRHVGDTDYGYSKYGYAD
jgi:Mrp family chromosome partitioning ATPase